MALTGSEKVRLAMYLGMTLNDLTVTYGLGQIEANADVETAVKEKLVTLQTIEDAISQMALDSDVTEVDEIKQKSHFGLHNLRQEGRRQVNYICRLANIEKWADVFNASDTVVTPRSRRFPQ